MRVKNFDLGFSVYDVTSYDLRDLDKRSCDLCDQIMTSCDHRYHRYHIHHRFCWAKGR